MLANSYTSDMTYIVFDIGGTKMRIAHSEDLERFGDPVIVPTPAKFEDGVELFRNTVMSLTNDHPPKAMAGGIRGPLNTDHSRLLSEIHLTDWVGKPIKEALAEACGGDVYLENDTAMVGLGEATHGAGKGNSIVAYITVSTGVGGAKIEDGKIDKASIGFEPGKMIIDPDDTLCPDCEGNTLESYVSGASVEKRFGMKPYEITNPEVWKELAKYLAIGVHNVVVNWSPDVVVLGGSMIVGNPAIAVRDVDEHFKELLTVFPKAPALKQAELGDFGGLYGGLAYLKKVVQ
mgnify:CR=1 FL=1